MNTTTKITLASLALALLTTGCTDPKAEERAESEQIRKEAKERMESSNRSAQTDKQAGSQEKHNQMASRMSAKQRLPTSPM